MTAAVDVLIVTHNCVALLPGLVDNLCSIDVPAAFYFVDNGSTDGTPDQTVREIQRLPGPAYCQRSLRNNGFGAGVNLIASQGRAPYLFLLNPDALMEPGCLRVLLERMNGDPRIGMCDARHLPEEHPKLVDAETGETSWCSGAALMIRRSAFEQAGGFDPVFFMYCEDVDLSWKLWISGWRCVSVRNALVNHAAGRGRPGRRTLENYYSFRNSLFLFQRYSTRAQYPLLRRFLYRRLLSSGYRLSSKALFTIALADYIRYIPALSRTKRAWSRPHPWIRLDQTSLAD